MGIFSRRPSRSEQVKMLAVSQRIMPLFMRLAQTHAVKFKDGATIELGDPEQQRQLLSKVDSLLDRLSLDQMPPYTAQAIADRARLISEFINDNTYEAVGSFGETASLIIEGLNVHEMFCFHYYELYPKFEPLREMTDTSVKIMTQALEPLFSDGLPDRVRLAFPRFAEHFTKIQAHHGAAGSASSGEMRPE